MKGLIKKIKDLFSGDHHDNAHEAGGLEHTATDASEGELCAKDLEAEDADESDLEDEVVGRCSHFYRLRSKIEFYLGGLDKKRVCRSLFSNSMHLGSLIRSIDRKRIEVIHAYEIKSGPRNMAIKKIPDVDKYSFLSPFVNLRAYKAGYNESFIFSNQKAAAIVASVRVDGGAIIHLLFHLQAITTLDNASNPYAFIKIFLAYINNEGTVLDYQTIGYSVDAADQTEMIRQINRSRISAMAAQTNYKTLNSVQLEALGRRDTDIEMVLVRRALARGKYDTALREARMLYQQHPKQFAIMDQRQRQRLADICAAIGEAYMAKELPFHAQYYLDTAATMPDVDNSKARDLMAECSELTRYFSLEDEEQKDVESRFPSKVGLFLKNMFQVSEAGIAQAWMIKHNDIDELISIKDDKANKGKSALEFDYLEAADVGAFNFVAIRTDEDDLKLAVVVRADDDRCELSLFEIAHIDEIEKEDNVLTIPFADSVTLTKEEFLEKRNEASDKVLEDEPLTNEEFDSLGAHTDMHYYYMLGTQANDDDIYGDAIYYYEKAYAMCAACRIDNLDHFDVHMIGKACAYLGLLYENVSANELIYKFLSHLSKSDNYRDRMLYISALMMLECPKAYQLIIDELKDLETEGNPEEENAYLWWFLRNSLSHHLEYMRKIKEAKDALNPLLADVEFKYRREAYDRMQELLYKYPNDCSQNKDDSSNVYK